MRKLMICYFVLFIFLLFIAILPIGCAQGDYANSNPTDRRDNVIVSPVPFANSELVKSETIYCERVLFVKRCAGMCSGLLCSGLQKSPLKM